MNDDVTIVIPVYNRADIVERTLQSVAAQTWRPLHVVLVDNASTDASLQVMEAWRRQVQAPDLDVMIVSERRPGAAAARNAGLACVRTGWTMFFDSDDTMEPEHVETAMRLAMSDPEISIVGWDVRLHQGRRTSVKPFTTKRQTYNCVMHGTLATQRYMCRTCLFQMAGGWNPNVRVWDDIELGVRLLKLPQLVAVKRRGRPMVDQYHTAVSITGDAYASNGRQCEYAIDMIDNNIPLKLKNTANLKRVILAAHYHREGARDDAARLRAQALDDTPSWIYKLMLKWAYAHTAMGLPGAARLLAPICGSED